MLQFYMKKIQNANMFLYYWTLLYIHFVMHIYVHDVHNNSKFSFPLSNICTMQFLFHKSTQA